MPNKISRVIAMRCNDVYEFGAEKWNENRKWRFERFRVCWKLHLIAYSLEFWLTGNEMNARMCSIISGSIAFQVKGAFDRRIIKRWNYFSSSDAKMRKRVTANFWSIQIFIIDNTSNISSSFESDIMIPTWKIVESRENISKMSLKFY